MYYRTGTPGWLRFGYSPGWIGRSTTGLPPAAQWIMDKGLMPEYLESLRSTSQTTGQQIPTSTVGPYTPFTPTYSREQEKQALEQQMEALGIQLDAVKKRLQELEASEDA
jgi:hypothetical protein